MNIELNLTISKLKELTKNFPNDVIKYFGCINDIQDFGKEHYKLLAGISRQLNGNIIELGTHKGQSAVSLTYGLKYGNRINLITFDIIDVLFPQCKMWMNEYGIIFKLDNLFDKIIREKYRKNIFDSDLIFIDVDPHNGIMEYEMYYYLKNNNYKGILLFDDIFLNENMKQLWDKIDGYKIDLTKVGHWSGTGMVSFSLHKTYAE